MQPPQLNVTLASDTSAITEAVWSQRTGIQSPLERLIPSTSYRRSLDLVSSWCEAVITLISSGIAFPPRANFVSTVTSPRGVRALRARRRQEPQQPHQAPRNQPETGATPKRQPPGAQPACLLVHRFIRVLLVSQHLKGVICCWEHPSSSGGREWLGERDRRLLVPKCTGRFRNSKAWARSLLLVFAVTQYAPDVRAIWEETIKASGNGY